MRSFIIRVYRRGPGGGLSGTLQPVGAAATQAPQAFASTAELLLRLQGAPGATGATGAPGGAAGAAGAAGAVGQQSTATPGTAHGAGTLTSD